MENETLKKLFAFFKYVEKSSLSIAGSFFEWFWTCGRKLIFQTFWKFSNFLEKVVFSLKTVGIRWFCVFYRVERNKLISAISRKNSNLHFSIIFFKKYVFLSILVYFPYLSLEWYIKNVKNWKNKMWIFGF